MNIHKKYPVVTSPSDVRMLKMYRRVNLDIFWSRRPGTVRGIVNSLDYIVKTSRMMNMPVPLPAFESWGVEDNTGMGLAVVTLQKSLIQDGLNANCKTHLQFDTIRKLRSASNALFESSAFGNDLNTSMKSKRGDTLHIHYGETQSRSFERFMIGMKTRMGQVSVRNMPFTSSMIVGILGELEKTRLANDRGSPEYRLATMCGAYTVLCFGGSLRGHEGLMLDGDSIAKHINFGSTNVEDMDFVLGSLYGYFKGEQGERFHVLPLASVTKSGIQIRLWLERLVKLLFSEGRLGLEGPAFCDEEGALIKGKVLEMRILEALVKVQDSDENAGGKIIPTDMDVYEKFGMYRSFRRGATCMAADQDVSEFSIRLVNRWRKFENGRGRIPNMGIMDHYLSNIGVLRKILSFSQNL